MCVCEEEVVSNQLNSEPKKMWKYYTQLMTTSEMSIQKNNIAEKAIEIYLKTSLIQIYFCTGNKKLSFSDYIYSVKL